MDHTTAGGSPGGAPGGDLLVDDPAVLDFLHRLQDAGRGPAPEIGDELAAVLAASGVPSLDARRRRPGRRAVAGVAVLGFMAAGVGAAAADGLPRPVQRVVSEVVSRWTPFDLPHPDDATVPRAVPTPSGTATPAATPEDSEQPQQPPAAPVGTGPTRAARPGEDEDGDDGTSGDSGRRTGDDSGGGAEDGEDRSVPTTGPTSGEHDPDAGGGDEDGTDERTDDGGGDGGEESDGDSSRHGGSSDDGASDPAEHD